MKRLGSRWGAASAWLAALLLAPCAFGAPSDHGLVAAVGLERSRFGAELGRELEASAFRVVKLELGTASWRELVPAVRGAGAQYGVAIGRGGERVILFSLRGEARVEREFALDTRDELARRRQWIALVEHLRALDQDEAVASSGTVAAATAVAGRSPPTAVAAVPEGDEVVVRSPDRWLLGAAAMVGYDPVVSTPTSHIVFVAERLFNRQLDARVQVFWPIIGSRADIADEQSRSWTFGATFGLLARLRADPFAAVQPFVGVAVGLELVLVDTSEVHGRQSSAVGIPSALVGATAGVRLRVARRTHLMAQVQAGDAVLLAPEPSRAYEKAAADAHFVQGAVGLLFDF